MRPFLCSFALFLVFETARGQEQPLHTLPYTPSLDTHFLNRSVDPCQNFYQFACGGWIAQNRIPPDQARWDVYSKLTNENQRFLWGILEQAAGAHQGRTQTEQQIGDYFHACMDEGAAEQQGLRPIGEILAQIERAQNGAELPALLAVQHRALAHNTLFNFGPGQDFANSQQVIAFADAGGLGLPDRDYYTKTDARSADIRKQYQAHVARMFTLAGDSQAKATAEAATVLQIETALARASLTRVELREPYRLFHKMTVAELQRLTPAFQWTAYYKTLGLDPSGAVNVTEPAFYQELNRQLTDRSIGELRAYLRWQTIHSWAPYLSMPFVRANFEFYGRTLHGTPEMPPRWKRCVGYVNRDLGEALGQVFVARAFTPEIKQRALVMTSQIEAEMANEIRELNWMSEETKQRALAKLHTIVNKIGYPDRWRDYSAIRLDPRDFAGNVRRAAEFEAQRQQAKINRPVDRGEWQLTPPTVNAAYDPQLNDITFPAGVLQPPLYDSRLDDAPNYGNTGSTIGHELTHGFDDEGRQFDERGNLRDWWTPKDATAFEQRAQCVIDQYGQYTVIDEIKINSKLTAGEDIADLGGTLLAYLAWKHAAKQPDAPAIEGLTPEQRFFIGFAQWACGSERPEHKRAGAITDPHSPDEYRINGVVADLPEFQRAFSCRVGQPMVRANACRIW